MDFPKTQEWVGLVNDRFANPDMEQGREGSRVPAEYLNAVGEEIAHVIEEQGHALEEGNNSQLNQALREALNQVIPLGTLLPVAAHLTGAYALPAPGEVSPQGFMRCDGAEIPAGNALQGHTPNLTDGRFLRGSTLAGAAGGAESFTLAKENLPEHQHSIDHAHTATSGNAGAHSHGTSGGIQGLRWKAATPGGTYFTRGIYPTVQYEYRTDRSGGSLAGWEYTHTTSRQGSERTRWVGGDENGYYETYRNTFRTRHYRRRVAFNQPAKYQLASGSFSVQSGGGHTHPVTVSPHAGQSGAVGGGAAVVHVPRYFEAVYLIKVN